MHLRVSKILRNSHELTCPRNKADPGALGIRALRPNRSRHFRYY
jgi:hypothetical protein